MHTHKHACIYIYIHTEKILEEINQNSKNNLGYMRYVMFGLFLFVFFFHYVLSQDIENSLCYYGKTLLFTHSIYKSLHLLPPNSQLISPSPPLATTSLFFISMSLFLFHR